MKSKGGKIFYRCEVCNSSDIEKRVGYAVIGSIESNTENFYYCKTCRCLGLWKDRVKESVAEYYMGLKGFGITNKRKFSKAHKNGVYIYRLD